MAGLSFLKGLTSKLPAVPLLLWLAIVACSWLCYAATASVSRACERSLSPDLRGQSPAKRGSWLREKSASAALHARLWFWGLAACELVCVAAQLGLAAYLLATHAGADSTSAQGAGAPSQSPQPMSQGPPAHAEAASSQQLFFALSTLLGVYACTALVQLFALVTRCVVGLPRSPANARFLLAAKRKLLEGTSQLDLLMSWADPLRPEEFCIQGIQEDLDHAFTAYVIARCWEAFIGAFVASNFSDAAFLAALDKQAKAALVAYECNPGAWRLSSEFWLEQLVKLLKPSSTNEQAHIVAMFMRSMLEKDEKFLGPLQGEADVKVLVELLCMWCCTFEKLRYASSGPFCALAAIILVSASLVGNCRSEIIGHCTAGLEHSVKQLCSGGLHAESKFCRQRMWAAILLKRLESDAVVEGVEELGQLLLQFKQVPADPGCYQHIKDKCSYVFSGDIAIFRAEFPTVPVPSESLPIAIDVA